MLESRNRDRQDARRKTSMGRSYSFECARCGYRAKVSGGADRGLNFFVQTILCRDCKELYDAVVRWRIPDETRAQRLWRGLHRPKMSLRPRLPASPPGFQAVLNRLPYRGVRHFKWVHFKPQCPTSSFHHVEEWKERDKCPRCGLELERSALPYRIWD